MIAERACRTYLEFPCEIDFHVGVDSDEVEGLAAPGCGPSLGVYELLEDG